MVQRQRAWSRARGIVAEGRDTGSVVFPHARYKFFLDADPIVRAKRRQRELFQLSGRRPSVQRIQRQLHFRDGIDRTRFVGPLVKPAGAVEVNTSRLTARQVVRVMLRHINQHSL
jgi:cytidylate kinase